MSGTYTDIAANNNKTFLRVPFFRVCINLKVRFSWIGIDVFYPSGEPILRCERSEAISGDCRVISFLAKTAACSVSRLHLLVRVGRVGLGS